MRLSLHTLKHLAVSVKKLAKIEKNNESKNFILNLIRRVTFNNILYIRVEYCSSSQLTLRSTVKHNHSGLKHAIHESVREIGKKTATVISIDSQQVKRKKSNADKKGWVRQLELTKLFKLNTRDHFSITGIAKLETTNALTTMVSAFCYA